MTLVTHISDSEVDSFHAPTLGSFSVIPSSYPLVSSDWPELPAVSDSWNIVNYSFCVLCEEVSQYYSAGKGFHGVFFKEALHWLGSIVTEKNSSDVIVTFNMSTETMVDMPLPENGMPPIDFQGEMYSNLGVWGDCICIACIWGSVKIDVWVMHEYGVKKSWNKIDCLSYKYVGFDVWYLADI
ncbi:F-box protein CPR1-like [Papaver somniferum]|uniref:F-box protein CPR1-like n=1 Tax=Papaver somniferum TaxID=3469 RepID=UPI000E6F80A2|nr:F-box protein CPR1-like [Papaver somniferum]XP_026398655.1 F-box protein CPR1-like [Papaver somniferum]XP_026398656.1 F-box protein CPR1-like [Papaver somniferum]XP_026398657.1 F-box protein CPR1-like [Papaver somniferum]XP_026398658.1 F-box protein CPR1-like [Papaver somniferum]